MQTIFINNRRIVCFMENRLEVIIIKILKDEKPSYELKGSVNYDSLSTLSFCAEVLATCLRMDYTFSKEEIVQFPFKYQNLTSEDIDLFKSKIDYYANRHPIK